MSSKHLLFSACIMFLFCYSVIYSQAQGRGEVMITNMHGQTRLWMMSEEWRPAIAEGSLKLSGTSRMRESDLLAIKPKLLSDTSGYHPVEVVLLYTDKRTALQTFWLPDRFKSLGDCPVVNGFHVVDERTWVREWDPLESTCRHASLSIL